MEKEKWYHEFINLFAILIIMMVIVYLYLITFIPIEESNLRIVDTILGFLLGSVIGPIVVWAFRSSKAQIDREKAEISGSSSKTVKTTTTLMEGDSVDEEPKS